MMVELFVREVGRCGSHCVGHQLLVLLFKNKGKDSLEHFLNIF